MHDGHFNLRGTNDMASGLCSWHDSANHSVHSEAATPFLQVIYRPKGPLGLRQNDVASGSAMHAHGAATWWRAAPPWGHADAHTSWDAHAIAGHAQPGDDGASRAGALWHAHAAAHDHGTTMWGDPTSTSAHDAYDAYHGCVYAKTSHGLSDPTPTARYHATADDPGTSAALQPLPAAAATWAQLATTAGTAASSWARGAEASTTSSSVSWR